jgi:hypothetical protein
MTDDMIERVARAIYNAECWDTAVPGFYQRAARTAIEAMREPTEEMSHAGWRTASDISTVVWQAMIDAALHEKE